MRACMITESGDASQTTALDTKPARRIAQEHWEVPVVARWAEGSRYLGVRLAVSAELDTRFTRPGQYVALQLQEQARFFVVAHRAGRGGHTPCWEFLIDTKGSFGSILAHERGETTLKISAPIGDGFDPQEVPRRALLFCTGSGVATMRPLLEHWLKEERPEDLHLYLGVETREELPYEGLIRGWREAGVEVAIAQGRGPSEARFVQDLYLDQPVPLSDALIYLSGAPAMSAAVKMVLGDVGLTPDQVRTNY